MCGNESSCKNGDLIDIKIVPVSAVLTYSLQILTIDADTGAVGKETYKKSELEVGLEWPAEAGMIYEMFLRVVKKPPGQTKVKPTIKIKGASVWNRQCTKTAGAITCHWTIDVEA